MTDRDPEIIHTAGRGDGGDFRQADDQRPSRGDPEIVSTPNDKTTNSTPREIFTREDIARIRDRGAGASPKRAVLWAEVETFHEPTPAPVYGAYPRRFLAWAIRQLRVAPCEVLHVCSGMLTAAEVGGGTRVDIRPEAHPDVVADGRDLPFEDASFAAVLIDPPYSVQYARDLYGTDYPRPSHLLREAARVVRPCGRIGIVHFLVPSPPPRCRIVAVRGVTQGCGYRIRALTVYEREQDTLPGLDR